MKYRPVVGFEGIYEVSSRGAVRRVADSNRAPRGFTPRQHLSKKGYLTIALSHDGVTRRLPVHTIVAAAFIGPRPKGFEINHKDGVKTNNYFKNLEYVTPAENIEHARRHGLRAPKWGAHNGMAKLTARQVRTIRAQYRRGDTQASIAALHGITQANVSEIVRKRTWTKV